MMTKKVLILVLLILVSGIGIVSAETIAGTVGTTGQVSKNWTSGKTSASGLTMHYMTIKESQFATGLTQLVHFDASDVIAQYPVNTISGNTSAFHAHLTNSAGAIIGNGTVGYQRSFSGATEIAGYQWVAFSDLNTTGWTGDKIVYLDYNDVGTMPGYPAIQFGNNGAALPTGGYAGLIATGIVTNSIPGNYIQLQTVSFNNAYSFTKPSGIGISGYVNKTVVGSNPSKVFIYDVNNAQLQGEETANTNTLLFSTASSDLRLSVQSSLLVWYNTSYLFGSTGPTPTITPTITPTPVPTVLPGYVRTTVAAWDLNGNMISGVNINIYDIEAAVWKNSTNDADGIEYIDTLPYHTLNIYGSYTVHPNVYTDAELLGMETGYYGNYYYLTLFPYTASPPGAGNTNLYIQVLENINKLPVPGVLLQVSFPGNATIGVYTNSAGVQVVTVPNNTVMSITATKAGWLGNVVTIDSGPGPTTVVGIGIDRAYVTTTPTITAGPGGVIPTTYLPGIGPTSSAGQISKAQDNEMMNKIRTAGPYLIDLAILATVMGLLYLIMGKK